MGDKLRTQGDVSNPPGMGNIVYQCVTMGTHRAYAECIAVRRTATVAVDKRVEEKSVSSFQRRFVITKTDAKYFSN